MNTLPLLSIIIPTYNLELWLPERCITSILEQQVSPGDYEIIVVDDGSDVSPQPLTESFGKPNIYFYQQQHKKQGAARNLGMEHARGEYILFIDADDYLFPDTLHHCIQKIKETGTDMLSFLFRKTYCREIETAGTETVSYSSVMSGAEYMYTHNTSGSPCLYIFRKDICRDNHIKFTENIFHEDEEFTTKLYFFARKILAGNQVIYAYYQRENSTVQKPDKAHIRSRFDNLSEVAGRLVKFREEQTEKGCTAMQQKGLTRKLNFLAVDFIVLMLRRKGAGGYLAIYLKELGKLKLYPLEKQAYSRKYTLFRTLANHAPGLFLLRFIERIRVKLSRA